MDGSIILWSALAIALLGAVLGTLLAVASRYLSIKVDSRIVLIREMLPGANCGNCGFPGCDALAEAIVKEGVAVNRCPVCDEASLKQIAAIMGIADLKVVPMKAVVRCQGEEGVVRLRYQYEGLTDCSAEAALAGGPWSCRFSCIGLGNCARVCPTHAITVTNGLAHIDEGKCIACGKCVAACPRGIIALQPRDLPVMVRCSNAQVGKAVREACETGCIGCGLCAKNCKFDAITLVNNLPVVNPEKCTGCRVCSQVCPRHCIDAGPGPAPVAYINPQRCNGCAKCAQACLFNAVSWEPGADCTIDASQCTGCGVCVKNCPDGAITLITR